MRLSGGRLKSAPSTNNERPPYTQLAANSLGPRGIGSPKSTMSGLSASPHTHLGGAPPNPSDMTTARCRHCTQRTASMAPKSSAVLDTPTRRTRPSVVVHTTPRSNPPSKSLNSARCAAEGPHPSPALHRSATSTHQRPPRPPADDAAAPLASHTAQCQSDPTTHPGDPAAQDQRNSTAQPRPEPPRALWPQPPPRAQKQPVFALVPSSPTALKCPSTTAPSKRPTPRPLTQSPGAVSQAGSSQGETAKTCVTNASAHKPPDSFDKRSDTSTQTRDASPDKSRDTTATSSVSGSWADSATTACEPPPHQENPFEPV